MKSARKYLHPSVHSLPLYLGIFAILLIPSATALFLAAKLQNQQTNLMSENKKVGHTQPTGKISTSKNSVANSGDTVTFTAKAQAQEGQVEYVRYYLLNPILGLNNDWGAPNWCSCSPACGGADPCRLKTWDLGESGDASRNYAISWGPDTTSGISTQVSRKLNPVNVPPGEYDVYIQVKDTAGNINEAADMLKITVMSGTTILGAQTPPQVNIVRCGQDEGSGIYSFAFESKNSATLAVKHLYQLDQGSWTTLTDTGVALEVGPGEHLFSIQAIDSSGEVATAHCNFTVK